MDFEDGSSSPTRIEHEPQVLWQSSQMVNMTAFLNGGRTGSPLMGRHQRATQTKSRRSQSSNTWSLGEGDTPDSPIIICTQELTSDDTCLDTPSPDTTRQSSIFGDTTLETSAHDDTTHDEPGNNGDPSKPSSSKSAVGTTRLRNMSTQLRRAGTSTTALRRAKTRPLSTDESMDVDPTPSTSSPASSINLQMMLRQFEVTVKERASRAAPAGPAIERRPMKKRVVVVKRGTSLVARPEEPLVADIINESTERQAKRRGSKASLDQPEPRGGRRLSPFPALGTSANDKVETATGSHEAPTAPIKLWKPDMPPPPPPLSEAESPSPAFHDPPLSMELSGPSLRPPDPVLSQASSTSSQQAPSLSQTRRLGMTGQAPSSPQKLASRRPPALPPPKPVVPALLPKPRSLGMRVAMSPNPNAKTPIKKFKVPFQTPLSVKGPAQPSTQLLPPVATAPKISKASALKSGVGDGDVSMADGGGDSSFSFEYDPDELANILDNAEAQYKSHSQGV